MAEHVTGNDAVVQVKFDAETGLIDVAVICDKCGALEIKQWPMHHALMLAQSVIDAAREVGWEEPVKSRTDVRYENDQTVEAIAMPSGMMVMAPDGGKRH